MKFLRILKKKKKRNYPVDVTILKNIQSSEHLVGNLEMGPL